MIYRISIMLIILCISLNSKSQVFTILPSQKIQSPNGSRFQTICWGDYDNDNDLDILVTGKSGSLTILYTNLGNDSFIVSNYNLPQLLNGEAIFADFDNDNDLDIFLSGNNNGIYITELYKNTLPDSVNFVKVTNSSNAFVNTNNSYAISTDIDNDGDLDIYHYGFASSPFNSNKEFYYINQSNNNFTTQNITFYPDYLFINFSDFNNDGFTDCIRWKNKIYSNSGDFNYQFNVSDSLPISPAGVFFNYIDINYDGRIDIQAFGKINSFDTASIKLYINYPTDSFGLISPTISSIPKTNRSSLLSCSFDANNNGQYDFILAGDSSLYFYNNNNFSFLKDSSFIFNFDELNIISAADYDNDGDLDIFTSGWSNIWPYNFATILRNDSTLPNTPPTAPITMWTTMDSTKVIFHWRPATDVETPQATLSYNLMVGSSPKAIDITSPMADTITGFRRIMALGNAQLNCFYILDKSNFNIGDTIYWSVQTIDNGFGYSAFSKESTTIICNSLTNDYLTLCSNVDSILWKGSYFDSAGIFYSSYSTGTICDSSFNLFIDTSQAYLSSVNSDICSGSTYTWKGNTYYNSGIYNIQHYTAQGCDSVERLVLNVRPDYSTLLTEDICMGDSLLFAGKHLKSSGVYWDTLSSIYACDSLLELTLSVFPADTSIVLSSDTLFATPQNASFRWWNCDKQEFVYAAYQSYFVPYQNGHYAAEISANGCSYLTQCYEITGLSIDDTEIPDLEVNLMPNPNNGEFYLELIAQGKQEYQILIFDALGKEIYNQQIEFENYKKLKLNLTSEVSGVYQLRIVSGDGIISRRFIIR